jgi:pimeloyl-ACP methyl ester carboxylesterase
MSAATGTVTSADGTTIAYCVVGRGKRLIVVGGALRTAQDYLPLAAALSDFEVYVLERRGRGASGPQGPDYSIEKECDDLLALQAEVGATAVFGHSFGGVVALETVRRSAVFAQVVVYEPGISLETSPMAWAVRYRRLLDAGRKRAAFTCFVRGSGHLPAHASRLPAWLFQLILRLVVRKAEWQRIEPLLWSNLHEHEQLVHLDGGVIRYAGISAQVTMLAGEKSPPFVSTGLYALQQVLPMSRVELLDGMDHTAPDQSEPVGVAAAVSRYLKTAT